jgi:hypothetical protein
VKDWNQRIKVEPPRPCDLVTQLMLNKHRCTCLECQRLIGWFHQLEAGVPMPAINLNQIASMLATIRRSDSDTCLDYGQMLCHRAGLEIRGELDLPIAVQWELEQRHTWERNETEARRVELWFLAALAMRIGRQPAWQSYCAYGRGFDVSRYLEPLDDVDGLPFDQRLRLQMSCAATDFHLQHAEQIDSWGRP